MHSALAWCEHEYINQVVKFSSLRFKALRAGVHLFDVQPTIFVGGTQASEPCLRGRSPKP
jgi:hypothetical protein